MTAEGTDRGSFTHTQRVDDTPYQSCTSGMVVGGGDPEKFKGGVFCLKNAGQQYFTFASVSASPLFTSPGLFSPLLLLLVSALQNIDSAQGRLDCKCQRPAGPAPKISTFTGDRSMASASTIASLWATVDHKPAIPAWSLIEAALHYTNKPRESLGTHLQRTGQQPWTRLSRVRPSNTSYKFH